MGSSAEEVWQRYNNAGKPYGEGLTKQEARHGVLHGAAHVWISRRHEGKIEVLLQERSHSSKTWPGHFDVSAAGHIDFGETPLVSAVRELNEELGLLLPEESLTLLYVFKQHITDAFSGIIENELQWVYNVVLEEEVAFSHADGEVTSVEWHTFESIGKMMKSGGQKKLVPHGDLYLSNLFAGIERVHESI